MSHEIKENIEAKEAVDYYHGLLNDQLAVELQAAFNTSLRARKLYFGERAICTVLRPHFYAPEQWRYLKSETEKLLGAFGKAHAACLKNPALRAQLDLEAYEEELFTLNEGYSAPWTTSRLDSFYDPELGSLRFVEYNAETPAGMTYEDQLAEAFLGLDFVQNFQKHYHIQNLPLTGRLLEGLLESYGEWGGIGKPQIAIVDWSEVPTLNEHELCRLYFEAHGVKTILADPRALEYRGGALYAADFRIDFIYKRVLCSELIERMGLKNPIVEAIRDHAICMSNGFSAKLMAKKASFALLSDEQNAYLFNAEECAAIEAHIPWTRRVEERKTHFHNETVDLLDFVANHRDNLVLKPNDEYGGRGVIIGWETSTEDWNAALKHALTTPHVVQERVHIGSEDFPTLIDGKLDISSRMIDADPYIFHGKTVSGCLTRLSSVTLLNVTAGGGSAVPTFIVRKM